MQCQRLSRSVNKVNVGVVSVGVDVDVDVAAVPAVECQRCKLGKVGVVQARRAR